MEPNEDILITDRNAKIFFGAAFILIVVVGLAEFGKSSEAITLRLAISGSMVLGGILIVILGKYYSTQHNTT